ncbi:hypothetical protein E4U23_006175 [Claviceps purpurea]|nr:hypothetical protein E4U23_006175 [Claviceps purpurea]
MLDLTVNDPSNGETMAPTRASVRARCSSRSLHSLQNLPLELLESIFLYSKNFALPRSSPLLGAKLSGKATLLRLFMEGFHDTWNRFFGIPVQVQQEASYPRFNAFLDSDIYLQSDLLSMPWVEIDFILEAQQIWADKFARGRCYRHYETEGLTIQDLYQTNLHARARYMQHVRQHHKKTWKFDARACFEADYERALQFPPGIEDITHNSLLGSADVHPSVCMPVDLINGPWDEEKKRRLFWLVRAGVHLMDSEYERSWNLRLAGLDAAVITPEKPDPFVIRCLINPLVLINLPPNAAHNRIVMMCRRIARGGDTEDMRQILRFLVREVHTDKQFLLHNGIDNSTDNSIDDDDDDEDGDSDYNRDDEFFDELYNELIEEGVE